MIYLLTPTGGRPEALALLGEYLEGQTYQGDATWLLIDDCDPQSRIPETRFKTEVIRPDWRWQPGMNTQAQSLLAGLERIPPDAVVFVIEDDDAYLPDYLTTMLRALESADLVGEAQAHYFNVRTWKYQSMRTNRKHSSLCSTAIRGTEPLIAACMKRPKFIDIGLWHDFKGPKTWVDARNCIGIKSLPGRNGIGVGHRESFGTPDTTGVIDDWLGPYAENYTIFRRQE